MLEQLVQLLQLKIIFLPWIKFFPSIPECICRFSPLSIQMFSCEPWVGATTGVIGCRARIQLTSMGGCRGILGRSRRSPASTDPWDWAGQLGGEGGTSRGTEVAGFVGSSLVDASHRRLPQQQSGLTITYYMRKRQVQPFTLIHQTSNISQI